MDSGGVEKTLNILQILPEFTEGGVERHVLWLANEMASLGHDVTVVSAGGKLEKDLKNVRHLRLPVHRKNLFTGLNAMVHLTRYVKKQKIEVLHAHSRVPAWISWWASSIAGISFFLTAHGLYSDNPGLIPYHHADGVICISNTVRDHLRKRISGRNIIILNGLQPLGYSWRGPEDDDALCRLLFIGRLTKIKGLHLVIEALGELKGSSWILDVVGDGPQREKLVNLTRSLKLEDRVFFHGFQDDPDYWMKTCSCFLFPSLEEGMGLTLMRAIQMGVPVIASDIAPVRELLKEKRNGLVNRNTIAWRECLSRLLEEKKEFGFPLFSREKLLTLSEAAEKTLDFYKMAKVSRN